MTLLIFNIIFINKRSKFIWQNKLENCLPLVVDSDYLYDYLYYLPIVCGLKIICHSEGTNECTYKFVFNGYSTTQWQKNYGSLSTFLINIILILIFYFLPFSGWSQVRKRGFWCSLLWRTGKR